MSATPDWVCLEEAITLLLPKAGGTPERPQLLARLGDYSAAAAHEARRLGGIVPSAAELTDALEWLLRPIFICGHQRSGTTLLQSLLDGHPQLLTLPSEGTYFASFPYVARDAPTERDMDRFAAEWIARFVDPNYPPHFRLGRSDEKRNPAVDFARVLFGWHESLQSCVAPRFAALLALAAAFRVTSMPESAPLMWVEKTPQNERYAGRFAPFQRARFVQLVRDPRASLASLEAVYRTAGIADVDAAEHARAIGRSLQLALGNPRRFGNRYLVVRYEDLVARPEEEVERVRKFLEIAPHPTLLVPTAGGRPVRANSSFEPGAAGTIEPTRHTVALSAARSSLLGVYAGSAARRLGYDIPLSSATTRCVVRLRHWPGHALRRSRAALRAVMRRFGRRGADTAR
jgi:hypothetical protein